MARSVPHFGWPALDYDRLFALFVVLFAVGCIGGLLLLAEFSEFHYYNKTVVEADGRDMCVLVDRGGKAVDRAFVHASEQCPDPGGWHTVERTANGDLPTAPVDEGRAALFAAMLLIGLPTSMVSAWKNHI